MPRVVKPSPSSSSPPEDPSVARREERLEIALPLKLIHPRPKAVDEVIPGVLIDLSASGMQILTDQRFSLLLPPTRNTRLEVEFFLDELEIRQVPIQVLRVHSQKNYLLVLGCKFINLPASARLALRAEVAKRLAKSRP